MASFLLDERGYDLVWNHVQDFIEVVQIFRESGHERLDILPLVVAKIFFKTLTRSRWIVHLGVVVKNMRHRYVVKSVTEPTLLVRVYSVVRTQHTIEITLEIDEDSVHVNLS